MEWRYIIKQLILPPGSLYVVLLFALITWHVHPRLARASAALAVLGLWLLSTPIMVTWLASSLESNYTAAYHNISQQADAIVILGGGREIYGPESRDHEVSTLAMSRVRTGAKLAQQTQLPVVVSGGLHYGQEPSEAILMARILMEDFGLPIPILEEKSRTTWENAVLTAEILLPHNKKRIAVVTHAWHMPRSVWSFEQQGFEVIPVPVAPYSAKVMRPIAGFLPEAKALMQNTQLINEHLGLSLYKLLY